MQRWDGMAWVKDGEPRAFVVEMSFNPHHPIGVGYPRVPFDRALGYPLGLTSDGLGAKPRAPGGWGRLWQRKRSFALSC